MAWSRTWARRLWGGVEPTPLERATLSNYLCGNFFQGLWWSGYLLIPYVLAKSLGAPGSLITLSVMMETFGMFLALYWGHLLATRWRRGSYLVWAGVLGRLSLLGTLLVHSAGQMIGLLAFTYFFSAMLYPAQNSIFQANFRAELRGRYFGLGSLIQNGVAVLASLGVGWLLDRDAGLFRVVYAALGVAGFVHLALLARVPEPSPAPGLFPAAAAAGGAADGKAGSTAGSPAGVGAGGPAGVPAAAATLAPLPRLFGLLQVPVLAVGPFQPGRVLRGLVRPFTDALATYRRDRAFHWFEWNFMTYGAAFMCLNPIVPLFLTERLGLNYQQISTARIVIGQIGVAALGPFMGRLMDRWHPTRLCALTFGLIALYPAALDLAGVAPVAAPVRLVYLAFALYSVGMAGINVAWNVGSIAFAPPGQGGYYQGIHVAMVGIRGMVGPLLGYAAYELFGFRAVFWLAAALFLAASASSAALWRSLRRGAAGTAGRSDGRGP